MTDNPGGSAATPGVPVAAARGGPQPSDGPGWRLLLLLVQGTRGECSRALVLVGAAVFVATLVEAVGSTAAVWQEAKPQVAARTLQDAQAQLAAVRPEEGQAGLVAMQDTLESQVAGVAP